MFYRWKKQFSELGLSELRELRSLRHDNSQLKRVIADLTLDRRILQEIVQKSCSPSRGAGWRSGRRRCIA
jgi:putative transposase